MVGVRAEVGKRARANEHAGARRTAALLHLLYLFALSGSRIPAMGECPRAEVWMNRCRQTASIRTAGTLASMPASSPSLVVQNLKEAQALLFKQ
jgi:hypothetical protein